MLATPPGNAPGGPRSLIGDADRDRMTALLREHYAVGRISLDELRRRVGVVLAAAYADEAAVALADLPPIAVTGAWDGRDKPGCGLADRDTASRATVADTPRRPSRNPAGCRPRSGSVTRPAARSCGSGPIRPTAAGTTSQTTAPCDPHSLSPVPTAVVPPTPM